MTVLYIVLGIESLVVALGFVLYIWDWEAFLRRRYAPNWKKALIKSEPEPARDEQGNYIPFEANHVIMPVTYGGVFQEVHDGAMTYSFKKGKDKLTVAVPVGYEMRFEQGKRVLRVYEGQWMAIPYDQRTWENIPAPMASLVLDRNLGYMTVNSITGGGIDWTKYIIPVAIILLIGVLGYFVYDHFQPAPVLPASDNVTQNQTIQRVP